MTHIDLFSGVGGFSLAAREVWGDDHEIVTFCEINKYAQQVLKKHWPGVPCCEDIRRLNYEFIANAKSKRSREEGQCLERSEERAYRIDLLTGGFPCQPFSVAGKQKGTSDDRHLWPEMRRVIEAFKPRWVVAENVRGIINIEGGVVFEQVCLDLEALGYEVQPVIIPACAVNAPHRRDRVWIIAHSRHGNGSRSPEQGELRKPLSSQEDAAQSERSVGPENNRAIADTTSDGHAGRLPPSSGEIRQGQQGGMLKPSGEDSFTSNSSNPGRQGDEQPGTHGQGEGTPRSVAQCDWDRNWVEVALELCVHSVDDGVSKRLVRFPDGTTLSEAKNRVEALKGCGNAIVPQVAMEIFRIIKTLEST